MESNKEFQEKEHLSYLFKKILCYDDPYNHCFYLAYRYLSCVVTAVGNRSNIFVMGLEAGFCDLNHYELRSASEPDGIPKMLELFSNLPS